MSELREEVPREFSDDERWYRYFTRKSIMVLLCMGVLSLIIIKFCSLIGVQIVGIYLALVLTTVAMVAVMLPIPEGDVLHGSGCTCDVILLRMYIRKKKARLYLKGFQESEGGEGNA